MDPENSGASTEPANPYQGERGRFVKGNPGRKEGSRNRATREGELVAAALLDLPAVKERVRALLTAKDTEPRVFVDLWKFLHEQRYGKALQRVDVDVRGAVEEQARGLGLDVDAIVTLAESLAARAAGIH